MKIYFVMDIHSYASDDNFNSQGPQEVATIINMSCMRKRANKALGGNLNSSPANFKTYVHSLPQLALQTFLKFLKSPQTSEKQWVVTSLCPVLLLSGSKPSTSGSWPQLTG